MISSHTAVATDRTAPRTGHGGIPIGAACVLVVLALASWVWSVQYGPFGDRFSAIPLCLGTFAAVQVLAPRARWDPDRALGPGNAATMLFALQLVVLPVLMVTSGPVLGSLTALPLDRYINQAMVLQAVAYAAYAAGLSLSPALPGRSRLLPGPGQDGRGNTGPAVLAGVYILVGLVGLVLVYPSVGSLVSYFSGQGDVFYVPGSASTLGDAAAGFLRPFLTVGLVVAWAMSVVGRRGRRVTIVQVGLAVLLLAVAATYDYNRAAVVVPLLALLTAYSCAARRLRASRILIALVLLAVVGFQFGEYRSTYLGTQGGRISAADAGLDGPGGSFGDELQVYGAGAQFWAAVIAETDDTGFRGGSTLTGSLLLPVPVLGEPHRATSGPVAYNELLYGRTGITDQNMVLGAELYWNGGTPAVVVGYVLLGWVVRRFDDLATAARDPLAAYTWAYCGLWTAMLAVNSLSVLAQIIVYFMPPIIAMVLWSRWGGIRPPEGQQ